MRFFCYFCNGKQQGKQRVIIHKRFSYACCSGEIWQIFDGNRSSGGRACIYKVQASRVQVADYQAARASPQ